MNNRHLELEKWLNEKYLNKSDLVALNNDASSRKYYRFTYNTNSLIAVDSPPDKENNLGFFALQEVLTKLNVNVPKIHDKNIEQGFYIVEDLGNEVLFPKLKTTRQPEKIYAGCINELIKIQSCDLRSKCHDNTYKYTIPDYDDSLLTRELELFREWFLTGYLGFKLSKTHNNLLDSIYKKLILNANEQPRVLVHRDFHSRNLLYSSSDTVSVIDFQDAVLGPATYDLVSLYRDCYIDWPQDTVEDWVSSYFELAQDNKIISRKISKDEYWHWFLKMTLQRNFKTIGIFSRLFIRDNKPGYLDDIPRTLNYALDLSKSLANKDVNLAGDMDIYTDIHDFLSSEVKEALIKKQNYD